jgi:hypothetical protein
MMTATPGHYDAPQPRPAASPASAGGILAPGAANCLAGRCDLRQRVQGDPRVPPLGRRPRPAAAGPGRHHPGGAGAMAAVAPRHGLRAGLPAGRPPVAAAGAGHPCRYHRGIGPAHPGRPGPSEAAYTREEFAQIKAASARTFGMALVRIRASQEHLLRWQSGESARTLAGRTRVRPARGVRAGTA